MKKISLFTGAVFILLAGCANDKAIVMKNVKEDPYPKINVIPYEKEFSYKVEKTFKELSAKEEKKEKKASWADYF